MTEKIVESSASLNWIAIFFSGSAVGIAVLFLLVLLSILTWGVIWERWIAFRKLQRKSEVFLKSFWDAKSLSELHSRIKEMEYSPAREIFRSGYNEMVKVIQTREKRGGGGGVPFDTVRRSLIKARGVEELHLATNMSFLAIAASACPFIGLFGTVIGIIEAFYDIGVSGTSSLSAVAPGISQSLIATALGLAAAIPAVVFYNYFSAKMRKHLLLLDGFSYDFLNILERHFNVGRSDNLSSGNSVREDG